MIIEGEDYKLEYHETSGHFDLYLLQVINAKNAEKRREELKLEGYNMPIESGIKRIINYRLNKKNNVIDMKEYLKQYIEENNKLAHLLEIK